MGTDYALVHVKYTIPPAVLLTLLYRPLFTKLDAYKVGFLVTVAVVSTIPWDSYLIRTRIWSYPSHVIIGPTLLDIPLEEVFFFIIQTYNTSLLYLILTRPTFQPAYLHAGRLASRAQGSYQKLAGQVVLLGAIAWGWCRVSENGLGTYTGLILVWSGPFLLLLWSLAHQFILGLPLTNTLLPIILPTLYLWVVDTLALRRGTWVISKGTKYSVHLWDGLEIEEALFFLVTNTLIVFGQLAFDNALAVLHTFPTLFPDPPLLPSPVVLMRALLTPRSQYDDARLTGLQEAVHRLKKKSRSFYLASSTFPGLLRADLLLLYSFCRVADDLVDNATTAQEAKDWITKLHRFLGIAYSENGSKTSMLNHIHNDFPLDAQSALQQLPVTKMSRQPLEDLLRGFEMDLAFNTAPPIRTEADLRLYSERVAGTVAQMCIELIFNLYPSNMTSKEQCKIVSAGNRAGIALQYVNIARDIGVDAKIGRVYLPSTWLQEVGMNYDDVLKAPNDPRIERLRTRLLDNAFSLYTEAKGAIEHLPIEARGPIRVAIESYMEIGRALRQDGYIVKAGRATVPKWRRLVVAWKTLHLTVPDNYTDEKTFLDHLQRNPRLQPYEFWSLMADVSVIVQHLASVAIFCCCFVAIIQGRVSSVSVVGWASLCTVLGWVLWDHWMGQELGAPPEPSSTHTPTNDTSETSFPGASTLSPRAQQRLATAKSAVLIYAALLGLSPILKSLTRSTTSDSIWAISSWLLMMNVAFFDYSGGSGAQ
ncbi:terpenoid synthase [Dothidotthia symphoricarpi CBS 119687]|uniref:Bifunctional lycopene cyclase/phytoene synthase n=1 Tax=Dothidotthia symphoricarpi CBS 119687 TaxID=1392245 RepID=A0A6A6AJ26_9PLEO|nr:terpenoid synthase [Dothidotthia symphoricarpi CBS 119687]KAF2131972.1 terpenoid synthase [Dothidotthia symphoricarpi CBS 119687]